jgi:hypothetical protein
LTGAELTRDFEIPCMHLLQECNNTHFVAAAVVRCIFVPRRSMSQAAMDKIDNHAKGIPFKNVDTTHHQRQFPCLHVFSIFGCNICLVASLNICTSIMLPAEFWSNISLTQRCVDQFSL